MADDDRLLPAQGLDKADNVTSQLENIVFLDGLRPVALPVTTLVRGNYMIPGSGEYGDLVPPRIP